MHYSARIHHRQRGEHGTPVVFLHGLALQSAMWEPQLAALKKSHRTFALDLPGSGGSPLPPRTTEYPAPSLAQLGDTVVAFMDQQELPTAHIVGFSLGGYVLLTMMRRHPERIISAVLADTRASQDGADERSRRLARADRLAQPGATMQEMVSEFAPLLTHPTATEEVKHAVAHWVSDNEPSQIAWVQRAAADRNDTFDALRQGIPTRILVGEHDAVTTRAQAQAMADAAGGLPIGVIPGTGHMSNIENPAAFNRELLAHFRAVDNSRIKMHHQPR